MFNLRCFPQLIRLFLSAYSATQGMNSQPCHPCPFPGLKSLSEKSVRGDRPRQAGSVGSRRERRGNVFAFFRNIRWTVSIGKKSAYAALVTCTCALHCVKPYLLFLSRLLIPARGREAASAGALLHSPAEIPTSASPSESPPRQAARQVPTTCIFGAR